MKINHLKGLYYFYVVAQCTSIKGAAEILFVTQAAVSQQLKTLENHLGEPLFHRQHRRLSLTDTGKRLFPFTQTAFNSLTEGLKEISSDHTPNTLTISVLPSFASRWLVPRLGSFYEEHPELTLMMKADEQLDNFEDGQVDLGIRFGKGSYAPLESQLLMGDYIYPVCHPLYQQQQNIHTMEDLKRCVLLSDSDPEPRFSWKQWLKMEDSTFTYKEITFEGANYTTEAATAGQGIALLRHSIAADLITAGSLLRLFDRIEQSQLSYYLCAPAHHFQREKVQKFSRWLKAQIDTYKQSP